MKSFMSYLSLCRFERDDAGGSALEQEQIETDVLRAGPWKSLGSL